MDNEKLIGKIKELLKKRNFSSINQMIKNGEISLDEFVNLICMSSDFKKNLESGYINCDTLDIAKNIEGLNESHILKLGIRFKQVLIGKRSSYFNLYDFLNQVPKVPAVLADNFAKCMLASDDISKIESFIFRVDNIPNSTNIILANGIVEMLNVYKLIDIDDIIDIMESYIWGGKISADALDIIAEPIIQTNALTKILEFASTIKDSKSNPKLWEDFTDKAISLAANNLGLMHSIAFSFPKANKAKLVNILITAKSFKWVYKFAKSVKHIPEDVMQTIITYVASTLSPEFIYLFLNNINLSVDNIKILTDAIMKTENADYIGYSVISLGRKGITEKIEKNKSLTKEQKATQIAKLGDIKSRLTTCLVQMGKLDFLSNYNTSLPEELEEKLLNSDNSIENPFAPTDDAKRMKLEGDAE